jgi:hypothetical protein
VLLSFTQWVYIFGEREILLGQNKTELAQLHTAKTREFKETLELLGYEKQRGEVDKMEASLALADVMLVMSRNNPATNPDLAETDLKYHNYETTRNIFMKACGYLWPEVTGSESEFGLARVRLSGKENVEWLSAEKDGGGMLLDIGGFVEGKPPTQEVQVQRINESLSHIQEAVGIKMWSLLTEDRTGYPDSEGHITEEDRNKLLMYARNVYVVEKYKEGPEKGRK